MKNTGTVPTTTGWERGRGEDLVDCCPIMREFLRFEGRGGTVECLLVGLVAMASGFGALVWWAGVGFSPSSTEGEIAASQTGFLVALLACPLAYASAVVRRLRDAGWSERWVIVCLIPVVGVLAWLVVALLPARDAAQ